MINENTHPQHHVIMIEYDPQVDGWSEHENDEEK